MPDAPIDTVIAIRSRCPWPPEPPVLQSHNRAVKILRGCWGCKQIEEIRATGTDVVNLSERDAGGIRILALDGYLLKGDAKDVGDDFLAAAARHPRVAVDLSGIEMINTNGMSLLLTGMKGARAAGGQLYFFGGNALVLDVLRRCRLNTILPMLPTLDEALKRLGGEAGEGI